MMYALMFLCLSSDMVGTITSGPFQGTYLMGNTCKLTSDMARVSGRFIYSSIADCADEGKAIPITDAATLVCVDSNHKTVWQRGP